jgi:hypothetical protein
MIPDISTFMIPLWYLLIPYGIFLLFFFVYVGFNLYHLLRFGTYGIGLYAITALFLAGTTMLVAVSYTLLSPYDWTASVSFADFFVRFNATRFFPGI